MSEEKASASVVDKPLKVTSRANAYVGAEVPLPFALRWQAYCDLLGNGKKRVALCMALEKFVTDAEKKMDKRMLMVYDALLENKAKRVGLSVNDLKRELVIPPFKPGRPKRPKK